jgi:predicted MFS family arabinose efflux permease
MRILWFVNLAILLAFIKIFETPPLIPILAEDLGISYAQAGIFMTAYALVRCLGSSPAGYVSDRWGAVPVVLASLVLMGLCGIAGTFGSNYELMLVLRILVSLGAAAIFIAAIDAIPKFMPAEKVGTGIGLINVSLNVGITLALFLTPILADAYGWRWTARIYSAAFLVLFVISLPLLKPVTMPTKPVTMPTDDGGLLSFGQLLRNPFVMLLALATCVMFVELYGVLTWVPAYLNDVFHYSPAQISICAMMFGLAAIPASMLTGYYCTSLRRVLWLCLSGGLMCGLGILALLTITPASPWITALVISVITWGHSQVVVTIMDLSALIVPPHSTGKALGVVFTVGYGGSILSTYLGGYLFDSSGGYTQSFIVFALAAFAGSGLMLVVYKLLSTRAPAHFSLARQP